MVGKLLFALLLVVCASNAEAATCFWVGGTGNWNDATHWSNASGGSGSTCAATSSIPKNAGDIATLDGSSGGGTVTLDITLSIAQITMGAFTGTFNDGGNTITLTTAFSNNGAATRTVVRSGAWTITASTGTIYNEQSGTLTLTDSGSLTFATTMTGTNTINMATGKTYNNVTFTPATNAGWPYNIDVTTPTFTTLTINKYAYLQILTNTTWTITNAPAWNAGSMSTPLLIKNSTNGTLTFSTASGNPTCTFCILNRVTFGGGATWRAPNSSDQGGNSGITITPPGGSPCVGC